MKELLPFLGSKKSRRRLDEVFSRNMLGSVLVGASAGKVVEKLLNLIFNSTVSLFFGWLVAFLIFLLLFVRWKEVEDEVEDATGEDDKGG